MATGKVKWFDASKRFGFIQPDGGGPDVFVHQADITAEGVDTLTEGQSVTFEITRSPAGEKAVSVKPRGL